MSAVCVVCAHFVPKANIVEWTEPDENRGICQECGS